MRNSSFLYVLVISVGLALAAWNTADAFIPPATTCSQQQRHHQHTLRATANKESSTKEVEKTLRQELTDRNSKVEDEGKYAVADGTGMNTEQEKTQSSSTEDSNESSSLTDEVKKLERLIKKRPYALFLAEKGVEIIEDTLEGFLGKSKNSDSEFLGNTNSNGEKEKVVVLGTGWGAAAFLKGIDTSQYDVTVISPRNYFVFTPMLAGASVGTVDYRSITEPIREVRTIDHSKVSHDNAMPQVL